jgi:hypothetical protein
MRWWVLWIATAATCLGQSSNSGDRNREHKEHMERYDRMNADLSASIDSMRQQSEMRNQTRELREQTELLRNISKKGSGGSSSSYVPPPIVVAPSSYVPPKPKGDQAASVSRANEEFLNSQILMLAQNARSFNAFHKQPREKQLSSSEWPSGSRLDNPTNDGFIEGLLQGYQGTFTDYKWSMEKVDSQTYLVTCSVSLDGTIHDFKFRINSAVGSCRYEGGTALAKLAPPKAFTPPPPIPDKQTANSESNEWWKEGSEPVEDSAPKPSKIAEKFDPDAYLAEKTTNSAKNKITFLDEEPTKTSEDLSFLDAYERKLPRVLSTEEFNKKLSKMSAIPIAKNRQNFSWFGQKPVNGVVSDAVEEDSNSQLITEWIENYAGEFADYGWRSEPIDAQTFLVTCEVSLDGEKHGFRFQVNTELMTCRYEGGTAYEKLRSNQRKTSWLPW